MSAKISGAKIDDTQINAALINSFRVYILCSIDDKNLLRIKGVMMKFDFR